MLHKARELLMRQQTMLVNALRAHMAELGMVAPQGRGKVKDITAVIEDEEDDDFRAQAERILDQEAEHRMSAAAERGRGLFFGKTSCSACHVP